MIEPVIEPFSYAILGVFANLAGASYLENSSNEPWVQTACKIIHIIPLAVIFAYDGLLILALPLVIMPIAVVLTKGDYSWLNGIDFFLQSVARIDTLVAFLLMGSGFFALGSALLGILYTAYPIVILVPFWISESRSGFGIFPRGEE